MDSSNLILHRSLLVVSFICNNRCKLCGVLSPYYKNPEHFSAKKLNETIKQYFAVVSYVEKFTLSGGEPLIHPELAQVVEFIKKYEKQFGKLEIITNGKLMMKPELLKVLGGFDKAEILIDDYGINSNACRTLEKQALENKISVNYRIYYGKNTHMGGWFDMGDFSRRDRSQEMTQETYDKCGMKSKKHFGLFIVGSEGHICFRSRYVLNSGIEDKQKHRDEFVDFCNAESVEKKKQRIKKMMNRERSYSACAYCWGQGEGIPRYPAGEQINETSL